MIGMTEVNQTLSENDTLAAAKWPIGQRVTVEGTELQGRVTGSAVVHDPTFGSLQVMIVVLLDPGSQFGNTRGFKDYDTWVSLLNVHPDNLREIEGDQ
jgi:hypothetical protein